MKRLETPGQRPVGHRREAEKECNRERRPATSFRCPSGRGWPPCLVWQKVRPPGLLSASPFSASWLRGCRAVRLSPSFLPPPRDRFSTLLYRARRGDFQPEMATLPSFQTEEPALSGTSGPIRTHGGVQRRIKADEAERRQTQELHDQMPRWKTSIRRDHCRTNARQACHDHDG